MSDRALYGLTAFGIVASSCGCSKSATEPRPEYYWMMETACPDSGVTIWLPAELKDHKDCEKSISRAMALALVYNVTNAVNYHDAHYHLKLEDRGFVFTEYVRDEKDTTSERPLGHNDGVHYHGVYVDLEAAKGLIAAVKAHQHGAE